MHSPEKRDQGSGGAVSDIAVLTQSFSNYLQGLCKAEGTIKQYLSDIKGWAEWWGRPVEEFDLDAWDAWTAWQAEQGYKGLTIRMHQMGVRRFFRFLRRKKIITSSPCEKEAGAESVEIADRYPEVLTQEEVERMRRVPRNPRTRALFALLYDCGLRNSEARCLPLSHIREDHVKVIGKKNRERHVPIVPATKAVLDAWIQKRPQGTEWLFPTAGGNPIWMEALCGMVKRWAKSAGIERHITAHTLRHSIATHLIERGMKEFVVQEFMGHKSIETTRVYVHIAQSLLKRELLAAHPLADK